MGKLRELKSYIENDDLEGIKLLRLFKEKVQGIKIPREKVYNLLIADKAVHVNLDCAEVKLEDLLQEFIEQSLWLGYYPYPLSEIINFITE
jgi:hypothetical protein